MDDQDTSNLIAVSEALKHERRLVALNVETGVPSASTIKKLYGLPVEEPKKVKISKEQQRLLDVAWEVRIIAKRRLDDNEDLSKVTALKNKYFSAIEDYKRVYRHIYGGE